MNKLKSVNSGNNKIKKYYIFFFLIITLLIVYVQITSHEFVWDDDVHITENAYDLNNDDSSILKYWRLDPRLLYSPVTYTFWNLLKRFSIMLSGGIEPLYLHIFSIILHLFNVLLIYKIILRIFHSRTSAFWGCLLFGLHPLQVEAVAWASAQRTLLMTFFGLLSILNFLKFSQFERKKTFFYFLSLGFFFLSNFAKPAAVVIPFIIFIILYNTKYPNFRRSIILLVPFILISLIQVIISLSLGDPVLNEVKPLWSRLFIISDTINFYLLKLLFPFKLSSYYGRTPTVIMNTSWFYLSSLIPFSILSLLIIFRKKLRYPIMGFSIFIIGILPVSGLITFEGQNWNTVADRYIYLPMLGFGILFAYLYKKYHFKFKFILFSGICLFWGMWSGLKQVPVWQNDYTLWSHTASCYSDELIPHNRIAVWFYHHQNYKKAIGEFNKAIEINPLHFQSLYGRALALTGAGRFPEAIEDYNMVINTDPDDTTALYNRALLHIRTGSYEKALADLTNVIKLNSNDAEALYNRAAVLYQLGKYNDAYADLLEYRKLGKEVPVEFLNNIKLRLKELNY